MEVAGLSAADSVLATLSQVLSNPAAVQKNIYRQWLDRLLANRPDITEAELDYENLTFFYPYHFLFTSPFNLPGMDSGIQMMRDFFHNRHQARLVLYADRDADGISAAAVLQLFCIEKMCVPPENVISMLPAEEDKYGITDEVAEKIMAQKPDYLFTLDNGSSNRDSLLAIQKKLPQLRIAVLDHHFLPESPEQYPQVEAFINPRLLDRHDPHANLCTAGLVYMFIWALTYSFTAEYNAVYRVKDHGKANPVYVKNGITIPEKEAAGNDANADEDNEIRNFDLAGEWLRMAANHMEINRVDRFIKEQPNALDAGARLFALQSVSMKKVMDRIRPYLSIAAVGTVGDLMELSGNNRILVYEGLRQINHNPGTLPAGILELLRSNDLIRKAVNEQDFSFTICPMINAPGRLGNAAIALETLVERDPLLAAKAASQLKKENRKRKDLSAEAVVLLESEGAIDNEGVMVLAYHPGVHRGISGIIASKLVDRYQKPALVLVNDGECLRGSVRSNRENVMNLLSEMSSWFIQFGGHAQAAGFSLDPQKKDGFLQTIKEKAQILTLPENRCAEAVDKEYSLHLQDKDITTSLWNEALRFAPYGSGNPHPELLIEATAPLKINPLGKTGDHARIVFSAIKNPLIEAVWFFHGGEAQEAGQYEKYMISAEPQIGFFMGKSKFQLKVTGLVPKRVKPVSQQKS